MNTHVDVALIGAGSKPGAIQEPTARTRPEVADHRRGIQTFRDNMGTLSGNGSIPLGRRSESPATRRITPACRVSMTSA